MRGRLHTHSPLRPPITHWAPPGRLPGNATQMEAVGIILVALPSRDTVRCSKSLSDELIWGFAVMRGTPIWGREFPFPYLAGGHWLQGGRHIFISLSALDMLLNIKFLSLKVSLHQGVMLLGGKLDTVTQNRS